jgi:hypothetical protein
MGISVDYHYPRPFQRLPLLEAQLMQTRDTQAWVAVKQQGVDLRGVLSAQVFQTLWSFRKQQEQNSVKYWYEIHEDSKCSCSASSMRLK